MARVHERIFAIVSAVLFLATTVGFSGAVIWQINRDNQAKKLQDQLLASTQPAKTNSSDVKGDTTKMLTGTKLSGFTPISQVNQLQIQDITVGTGAEATATSTVTANYVGALASDGTIFDASADHGGPQTFSLSQVIPGWTQGVAGMKVGGKRHLLIPASLGYGTAGSPPRIGPNANLVFDIELVAVK